MSKNILTIDKLSMRFGGILALDNVSFEVEKGSITALIGPNGAGKTTVFNCITGFYKATSGALTLHTRQEPTSINKVLGQPFQLDDIFKPRQLASRIFYKMFGGTHRVNMAGLARTFQNIQLFNDLTVIENLQIAQHNTVNKSLFAGVFNTKAFKESEQASIDRAYELLEVFNLTADANRLAGEMSYGQQRRLEIARAICTNPEMIALDEPAAGLNPNETEALAKMIQMLRTEFKMTVMLIEHDMGMVMKVSDFIIVLDHGEVIAKGTPDEILNNPKVIAAYLGVDDDEVAA
jgi:branched-chain amino acid transport system ATP-binding protein